MAINYNILQPFQGRMGVMGQIAPEQPSSEDNGLGSIFSGLGGLVNAFAGGGASAGTPFSGSGVNPNHVSQAIQYTPGISQVMGQNQGRIPDIMTTNNQNQGRVPNISIGRSSLSSKKPISSNISFAHGGQTTPTALIFHDTAGPTLKSATETLKQRGLSYNYIIDKDGTVHNLVPPGMKAFHAKGYNDGTVGISFVGGGGFGNVNPLQQKAAVELSNQLKQQFPSINSFAGHRDRTHAGKPDPEGFDYTGFASATGLRFEAGPGSERFKYDNSPGKQTQVVPQVNYNLTQNPNDELPAIMSGIAHVESSGAKDPYSLQSKPSRNGDRAYGKYQIMGSNVPSWSREALGYPMTPQQFLSNPEAQEKVARYHIQKYYDKYKNPDDVYSSWFSGRPVSKAGNAKDVYGTSVPMYLKKARQGYLKAKEGSKGTTSVGPMSMNNSNRPYNNPAVPAGYPNVPAFDRHVPIRNLNPNEIDAIMKYMGGGTKTVVNNTQPETIINNSPVSNPLMLAGSGILWDLLNSKKG